MPESEQHQLSIQARNQATVSKKKTVVIQVGYQHG